MGPEEFNDSAKHYGREEKLAAELAALAARVEILERELVALRGRPSDLATEPTTVRDVIQPLSSPSSASAVVEEFNPPPPNPPVVFSSPQPTLSLENRLGAQIFNRIGVIALLIGATWFLKLAMDNHWIGPVGRIVAGLIAGAGIIVWSERFRRKGFPTFSYSLKAIGSGALYLSLWAAFQLYHLLPAEVALGAMIAVTAWNAYMAWAQDSELLAAYALAGGLATPLLLSTGGNHEIFLFTYLLALDIATVILIRLKPWPRLLLGAFPATVVYFIGWYVQFFTGADLLVTSIFIALFFAAFASVSIVTPGSTDTNSRRSLKAVIAEILLPLANAAFVSLALYSVLQDSGRHAFLPWLMVILAAIYLGLMRLPQSEVSAAIHLSLAVVFLTIAIPLKASGHWITVAWFVEGIALVWVASRITASTSTETSLASSGRVLLGLASGALLLGLGGVFSVPFWFDAAMQRPFFNANFATALIGIAAFASAAWLALRVHRQSGEVSPEWIRLALGCVVGVNIVAVLLSLREIAPISNSSQHVAFLNPDFATALVGIATLAAAAWVALRVSRKEASSPHWLQLAGASIIAINLIALLAGVREIEALWSRATVDPEADLQRALGVSAFLMVYGGALLAIGFWKRAAFIRWQALILIVLTIAKTFLYDMRSLSQGYRVVSFLCLGVLLMAISFAYQKDWLALRDPAGHTGQNSGARQ